VPQIIFLEIALHYIFFSSPTIPHLVIVANGSKVASQGISQVPLSPLNLDCILYIPHCPYIVSLSQLTHSLNFDSFVIQELGMNRLIGKGHESQGLYYLKTSLPMSYFATSTPKHLHDRV